MDFVFMNYENYRNKYSYPRLVCSEEKDANQPNFKQII